MTPIQPVPVVVLPAPFPTTADRVAGIYNAKAKTWADKEAEMAQSLYSISGVTYNNAIAANERAEAAEATRAQAVLQTTEIKNAAVSETGAIRDQAIEARDAAAESTALALGVAHYAGRWSDLSGALATPASVWHAGSFWGLLESLANVAVAEPGVSAAWAAVGTQVHRLTYEQRGQLRTLGYPGLAWAMVDGLGLFAFEVGAVGPDDDETAFVKADGAWLMQCPSFDLIDAWMHVATAPTRDAVAALQSTAAPLRRVTTSSITTVAANTKASFDVDVPGAVRSRGAFVSPPADLVSPLSLYARVSALNTVTVYITNPSATPASVSTGEFLVTVI